MIQAPPIDPRSRADVVRQLRLLAPHYVPEWPRKDADAWPAGDPGAALMEIFGRFVELILERLNRVPDKNFLAFLDMIGVSPLPPKAARAPVQFFLAGGTAVDGLVPRGTPVATPDPEPQVFETERDLTVTPARLVRAVTFDPRGDRYDDHTPKIRAEGIVPEDAFGSFAGSTILPHALYLGHDTVLGVARPARLGVRVELPDVPGSQETAWLTRLSTLAWWMRAGGKPVRLQPKAMAGMVLRGVVHTNGVSTVNLIGSGTTFTEEIREQDLLLIPGEGVFVVNTVVSPTALALNAPVSIASPGVAVARVSSAGLSGTVHTSGRASTTLTGVGTSFTSELTAGDTLVLPDQGLRTVVAVASSTSLTLDAAATLPGPPGVPAGRDRRLALRGRVHTGGSPSANVTGTGTEFLAAVRPGDVLAIAGVGSRTVQSVASDTALTLDQPVTIAAPGARAVRTAPLELRGTVHTGGLLTTVVTGVGSDFIRELRPSDRISIDGVGPLTVSTILSSTSLILFEPASIAGPPGALARRVRRVFLETLFDDVSGIDAWELAGATARWLWAKTVLPLTGREAAMPKAHVIAVRAESRSPLPPDSAVSNAAPLNLATAGGFAFGDRPKAGDTFLVRCDEAFARTGAGVTLSVNVSFPIQPTPAVAADVGLAWEFWDGTTWASLGTSDETGPTAPQSPFAFVDNTHALTIAGTATIRFQVPPALPVDVAGQPGLWIRARIASGGYGEDAKLQLKTGAAVPPTLADWVYTPPTYRPPFLSNLTLRYSYDAFQPVHRAVVQTGFAVRAFEASGSGSLPALAPFVPAPDADPALALGFDRAFSNRPVSMYLAVAEPDEIPALPVVAWEYWNGGAWAPLGVRDGTRGLTEPGTVEFLGPADFAPSDAFGATLHWLRARLVRGDKSLFTLEGVHPSAVWARQATTARDEVIGSSNGKPRQTFTVARRPVLESQRLEVREPEIPSADEVALLEADGEKQPVRIVADETGRPREIWVRWHEVDHFHLSGPHHRHYLVDRVNGIVRTGDGARGRIPPPGRDNVLLAEYQAGGGRKGNVPAGAITVMKRAIPFIDRLSNPFAAGGGSDAEDLEAVRDRGPRLLKHRDQPVTCEDFEWLAREASLQVVRSRCLSARDPSTAGTVRLLIVPEGGPRPVPSPGLIRIVKAHLDARRLATADLTVVGPKYVEVSVKADVVPASFEDGDAVRRRVVERLTAFLHPLTGGPQRQGWAFGRDVYLSEVAEVIEGTEGMDHLKTATLTGSVGAEDRIRDTGRRVEVREDEGELVASGTHVITLSSA